MNFFVGFSCRDLGKEVYGIGCLVVVDDDDGLIEIVEFSIEINTYQTFQSRDL